jgi:hypothetical protein
MLKQVQHDEMGMAGSLSKADFGFLRVFRARQLWPLFESGNIVTIHQV